MDTKEFIRLATEGGLEEPDRFLHDDIIQRYIKPKFIALEPELFRSKWFDYRFLTPFQATLLYAAYYEPVYAEQVQRYATTAEAEYRRPITMQKILDEILKPEPSQKAKSNFSALYRGRAVADAIGAPYDFFIRTSFDKRMRAWQNRQLPRPHHLYSENFVPRVIEEWEKHKTQIRLHAKHPAYKPENYIGLAVQDDYRQFLLEQGHRQFIPNDRMRQYVYDGLITQDQYEKFVEERRESIRNPSNLAQ